MGHGTRGWADRVRAADGIRRRRARPPEPLAVEPLAAPRHERAAWLRVAARARLHRSPRRRCRGRPVHPLRARRGAGPLRVALPAGVDEPRHRLALPPPRGVGQLAAAPADRPSPLAADPRARVRRLRRGDAPRAGNRKRHEDDLGRRSVRGQCRRWWARCWRSGCSHRQAETARRRPIAAGAAAVAVLAAAGWSLGGPFAPGWSARAGGTAARTTIATPRPQLARPVRATLPPAVVHLPFTARYAGRLTIGRVNEQGRLTVRIDGALSGATKDHLEILIHGIPLEDGGVAMEQSRVRMGTTTPLYRGEITSLHGHSSRRRAALRPPAGADRPDPPHRPRRQRRRPGPRDGGAGRARDGLASAASDERKDRASRCATSRPRRMTMTPPSLRCPPTGLRLAWPRGTARRTNVRHGAPSVLPQWSGRYPHRRAPVAQWIEQRFPKPRAQVRFLPGALSRGAAWSSALRLRQAARAAWTAAHDAPSSTGTFWRGGNGRGSASQRPVVERRQASCDLATTAPALTCGLALRRSLLDPFDEGRRCFGCSRDVVDQSVSGVREYHDREVLPRPLQPGKDLDASIGRDRLVCPAVEPQSRCRHLLDERSWIEAGWARFLQLLRCLCLLLGGQRPVFVFTGCVAPDLLLASRHRRAINECRETRLACSVGYPPAERPSPPRSPRRTQPCRRRSRDAIERRARPRRHRRQPGCTAQGSYSSRPRTHRRHACHRRRPRFRSRRGGRRPGRSSAVVAHRSRVPKQRRGGVLTPSADRASQRVRSRGK